MAEFFRWENLVFLGPLLVGAVLYLALTLVGDIHHDGHAEVSGHGDVGADHAHASGGDVSHDSPDTDGHGWSLFDLIGIGKAPLGVIAISMTALWALVGFISLQILGNAMVFVCMGIAGVAALTLTRMVAGLFGRTIPPIESYAQSGLQFWGSEGVVRYTIRSDTGTIQVKDRYGNTIDLECRLSEGQAEVPPHTRVRVDDFDDESRTYRVEVIDPPRAEEEDQLTQRT